jgi:O-antigen ligase
VKFVIWLVIVAAVPLVAAAGLMALRSPLRYLLPAYAALLPYGSSISTGLPSSFGSLSSALGLLLALGLLAQLWTTRRGSPSIAPSAPLWLLFLAVTGASVFWSVAPRVTASEVIILASQVVLYAFLVLCDIDRAALVRTENALLAGAVACACYGVAQLTVLGGLPIRDTGTSARFGNGLLGPNNQAAAFLLPLAVALTRLAISHAVRERVVYTGVTVVLMTGIVLTGSRGGLLGVLLTASLVIALVPRGRSVLVLCYAVALLGLVAVLTVHPGGVGERQSAQTDSSGRTDIWRVGLSACSDYCLLGSGWGTFPEVYAARLESVPEARVLVRGSAFEPHNIWLLAAVESGVGGLLLMTSGLLLGLRKAWKLPKRIRAAPTAGLAGTILAALFLSNLEYKFFWFALAFPVLWGNAARRESEQAPDTHGDTRLATRGAGPHPPLPGPGVLHGSG